MGLQKTFYIGGGFNKILYYQIGESIITSNDLKAKIMAKINGTPYDGLPTYSNTSDVYLKINANGEIIQARIYNKRMPVCDFDWDHEHRNANGEIFKAGIVHVQEFKQNSNGNWVRQSNKARYMSDDEIERYGELLLKIKPDIKFRP